MYCPKCGKKDNFHFNYDYSLKDKPVIDILCNECGCVFIVSYMYTDEEEKEMDKIAELEDKINDLNRDITYQDSYISMLKSNQIKGRCKDCKTYCANVFGDDGYCCDFEKAEVV